MLSVSNPRPMPEHVLRSYREEIDFPGLYNRIRGETDESGHVVMERIHGRYPLSRLAEIIAGDLGCPDMEVEGYGPSRRQCSFVEFPMVSRGNPSFILAKMMSVPDFGGYRNLAPILAEFMEPSWQAFWTGVSKLNDGVLSTRNYFDAISKVLGPDQICWILLQSKRHMLSCGLQPKTVKDFLRDIEQTEEWLSCRSDLRTIAESRDYWSVLELRQHWCSSSPATSFDKAANIMSVITRASSRDKYSCRREIVRMIRTLISPSLIQPKQR